MIRFSNYREVFAAVFVVVLGASAVFPRTAPPTPRVFLLNPQTLQRQRRIALDRTDTSLKPAIARLERDAEKIQSEDIKSIVTKTATPPSGDRHDYMSQAPYFWRNPDTATGFPYVRRDGEVNPEGNQYPDHLLLDKMISAVNTLALAYYFTDRDVYATKVAEILRMWFLDPRTKMNPNLEFAQAIPGSVKGRGIGIIETRSLPRVVDAIGLLNGAKVWTKADQAGMELWFSQFLTWLTDSDHGRAEAKEKNNHGTFYDVQVISYALFLKKTDLARKVLESAKEKRIKLQVEADGRQPLELARTKSWNYSNMNLSGLIDLAELGEAAGMDLWHFHGTDGGGIRAAIEFLSPYAVDEKKWTFQQIEKFRPEVLFVSVRRASVQYDDEAFHRISGSLPTMSADDRDRLFGYHN